MFYFSSIIQINIICGWKVRLSNKSNPSRKLFKRESRRKIAYEGIEGVDRIDFLLMLVNIFFYSVHE